MREEAGELCQTLEANEGKERAASEMADLLYHAMVLLNLQASRARICGVSMAACVVLLHGCHAVSVLGVMLGPGHCALPNATWALSTWLQGVSMGDVMRVLRTRFGTSGVEEKAARPPKQAN